MLPDDLKAKVEELEKIMLENAEMKVLLSQLKDLLAFYQNGNSSKNLDKVQEEQNKSGKE